MILSERRKNVAKNAALEQHIAYIEKIVTNGGPNPTDPSAFDCWLEEISRELRLGKLDPDDLTTLRNAFGEALSRRTLQGFSLRKPHGYPGDYEIIDKIYLKHTTDDPTFEKWDRYYQNQSAAIAVRNRKTYFLRILGSLIVKHSNSETIPVLNVASGPARDLLEFYTALDNGHNIRFQCVDLDGNAIEYAKGLCRPFLNRIDFHEVNALRYRSERNYKLIWSAGLFDYLGTKGFQFLLSNLLSMVDDNGELIIGNFGAGNPTREYMEIIADWSLYYRTREELISLAQNCGIHRSDIRVGQEPEGINLFLHVKKGPEFLDLESGHQFRQ